MAPENSSNFNNPFKKIFPHTAIAGSPGSGPDYVREIDKKIRQVEPVGDYIPYFVDGTFNQGTNNWYYFQFGEVFFGTINRVILNDFFQNPAQPVLFRVNGRVYPFNLPSDTTAIEMNVPIFSRSTVEVTWSLVAGPPQVAITIRIEGFYYNK